MADLCDNILFVRGPTFDVEVFILNHIEAKNDQGGSAWLDLDSIIPYPEKFRRRDEIVERWDEEHTLGRGLSWKERPADGYNHGGYDWCIRNWGTKWNTYFEEAGDFDWDLSDARRASATLWFYTASTPISRRIMLVLSRFYPSVTFELKWVQHTDPSGDTPEDRGRIKTREGKLLADTWYRRRWVS